MIFAIPIEIKVREFLNKIYLASQVLKNTDFNIKRLQTLENEISGRGLKNNLARSYFIGD